MAKKILAKSGDAASQYEILKVPGTRAGHIWAPSRGPPPPIKGSQKEQYHKTNIEKPASVATNIQVGGGVLWGAS